MTQNIYDDEGFFAEYSRLGRSIEGLDGAAEWPALSAMLPDMQGIKVLDLGCGFGWFCRYARQQGAAAVVGIDVSQRMLARAAADTSDAAISYIHSDLEQLEVEAETFDLVYSSLALHYIAGLDRLLSQVGRSLRPAGRLVFSVEHPIYTAPAAPQWSVNRAGRKVWPLSNYLDEGPRSTDWLTRIVVKQHRTIATYANLLLQSGFTISHLDEWGPSKEQIAARPALAEERERPMFLLVSARRESVSPV